MKVVYDTDENGARLRPRPRFVKFGMFESRLKVRRVGSINVRPIFEINYISFPLSLSINILVYILKNHRTRIRYLLFVKFVQFRCGTNKRP